MIFQRKIVKGFNLTVAILLGYIQAQKQIEDLNISMDLDIKENLILNITEKENYNDKD